MRRFSLAWVAVGIAIAFTLIATPQAAEAQVAAENVMIAAIEDGSITVSWTIPGTAAENITYEACISTGVVGRRPHRRLHQY